MKIQKIHLGTDHAGYEMKEFIKNSLTNKGYSIVDHGANILNTNDDYPDYVKLVAESIINDDNNINLGVQPPSNENSSSLGIIFGGSGQGEAMVANRYNGIRAGVYYGDNGMQKDVNGHDLDIITSMRQHNNANVLSIGARFITNEQALNAIMIFITTKFTNDERHLRRVEKIEK